MRIDVVTIFPDYLAPLDLSLIGRARRAGLLDVRVRNLREHTHDRHRTVDDTPYGGGAGMVMRAEPWGQALDAILADGAGPGRPRLVVPSPAGTPFTQARARQLAAQPWLVFACGRYEGIDERVYAYAHEAFAGRVDVVSLGDYVLAGGEVAAVAMVEAIGRLLPGVLGNEESLVEESHEGGVIEYPVYTKPPVWRDLSVPAVLRSGDHGRIAGWRREQQHRRTAQRRPDLLHPSAAADAADLDVRLAVPGDVGELFTLTRACWVSEAHLNDDLGIPPLVDTLADLRASLTGWRTWVARSHGRLVASVRGRRAGGAGEPDPAGGAGEADPAGGAGEPGAWEIGRLMVAPDLQGRGLGRAMLELAEGAAPEGTRRIHLITGVASERNQRLYRRAGYRPDRAAGAPRGTICLAKHRR